MAPGSEDMWQSSADGDGGNRNGKLSFGAVRDVLAAEDYRTSLRSPLRSPNVVLTTSPPDKRYFKRRDRKEAFTAIEAVSRSCDGGHQSRKASLLTILGLLYAHGPDIQRGHVAFQEVLLQRVVAQITGKDDMPVVVLWCMYLSFGAWRVLASSRDHEEVRRIAVHHKVCWLHDRNVFNAIFHAWFYGTRQTKKKRAHATKVSCMLFANCSTSILHALWMQWHKVCHVDSLEFLLKAKVGKALGVQHDSIDMRAAFVDWQVCLSESRKEAEKVLLDFQHRSTLVSVLAMHSKETMMHAVYANWRRHTEQMKEREFGMQKYLEINEDQAAFLKKLMGNGAEEAIETAVIGWIQAVQDAAAEKRGAVKYLMSLCDGQEELVQKTAFLGWRQQGRYFHGKIKSVRELALYFVSEDDAALENCLHVWHQSIPSQQANAKLVVYYLRCNAKQGLGASSTLSGCVFSAWKEAAGRVKRDAKLLKRKQAQQITLLAVLSLMCSSNEKVQSALLLRSWRVMTIYEMKLLEKQKSLMEGFMCLFGIDQRILAKNVLQEWRKAVQHELEVKEQSKEKQDGLRVFHKMFAFNRTLLLTTCFRGWRGILQLLEQHRVAGAKFQRHLIQAHCFQEWVKFNSVARVENRKRIASEQALSLLGCASTKLSKAVAFHCWQKYVNIAMHERHRDQAAGAMMGRGGRVAVAFHFSAWVHFIGQIHDAQVRSSHRSDAHDSAVKFLGNLDHASLRMSYGSWLQEVQRAAEEHRQDEKSAAAQQLWGQKNVRLELIIYFQRWGKTTVSARTDRDFAHMLKKHTELDTQVEKISAQFLAEGFLTLRQWVFHQFAYVTQRQHRIRLRKHKDKLHQDNGALLLDQRRMRIRTAMLGNLRRSMVAWHSTIHYPRSHAERRIRGAVGQLTRVCRYAPLSMAFPVWALAVSAAMRCRWSARMGLVRWLAASAAVSTSHAFHGWRQTAWAAARKRLRDEASEAVARANAWTAEAAKAQARATRAERLAKRALAAAEAIAMKARRYRLVSCYFAMWRSETPPAEQQP